MPLDATARLSAFSGCGWGVVAYVIGHPAFGHRISGGIVAAPLIGILVGHLSRPFGAKPRWMQILWSLLFLYFAATCFAIVIGSTDFLSQRLDVTLIAALTAHILAVLSGLTGSGYFLVLWPLSFFNHRLLWQANLGHSAIPPQIPLTTAAVRTLALDIIPLSVLAYFAWSAFQMLDIIIGWLRGFGWSRVSTMPWWVVTDVMGWSNWAVFGSLIWLTAPVLSFAATKAAGSKARLTETYADLVGLIGFAVLACPIFLWAARLIVVAIKMTLAQSWATEGTVFWESYYYQNVFWMHFHYLVIGCALMAIRRMIGDR
ncbi:MAG: hypothetical protein EHM55_11775 [Acidobacteria bacterium]|nr:MAG: hypothetical protein EHM55_11775 [Acidobacteriota bacterium]